MNYLVPPKQCVILVGGLGTRLGPLTQDTPKPLLEVAGEPFLENLLWHAKRFGFKKVLLLAGFRADKVASFAESSRFASQLDIQVLAEPSQRGTGGALHFASDHLDETFLLLNGDSVFDFNWLDLVPQLFETPGAIASMGLRQISDASRFGVAKLSGGKVTDFLERGGPEGGLVNGGVYLLSKQIVEYLRPEGSLERDVLPSLARMGLVTGKAYSGFFLDIGVPETFAESHVSIPASLRRAALFLDRDGVVNVDRGYVGTIERFEWMPGAIEAIKLANDSGMLVFFVTNQAGVARGFYDETAIQILHAHVQDILRLQGAHIDDIRYCPYHPDGTITAYAKASDWRKPAPGMLIDLLANWPVDRAHSVMVGDRPTDIEAGNMSGLNSILFDGNQNLVDIVATVVSRLPTS